MKARTLLALLLGAATVLPAYAAEPLAPRRAEKVTPVEAVKSSGTPERLRKRASVAVLFTDDADSAKLPGFATPTTPLPVRFMRVGVEWTF